ncbi:HK97 family phage prohead protease [Undibacterium aquatile]|uniref:HK97 family phage prohead protease n=1 Tax=Undibacterium aquatile TaxID=1537398 RepID=A0ABR6XEL6_9BURK|nr:HK97 family phage prohead protease [Undibacterium aquatile]MBC3811339.1 HK97 family phage prohead protease [Undibacterium aquatile]
MKHKNKGIQHKQFAFKTDVVNEDGTFTGYGSVFGNIDSYKEIVAPGAFKESIAAIKASGDPLPALWNHRPYEPIGGYDILQEDSHGLRVEGWLLVNQIPRAAEVHALMKRRVVKGLSIGYYVLEDSWNEKTGVRTLIKLDLQEISPVTFAANVEAQIESVKSILAQGNLPTLSQFEDFLRESGYSKSQATIIASKGLKELLSRSESGGKNSDALSVLQNFKLSI